ncbi:MAG: hypothetical protein K2Y25_11630 [Pseudomonadaceae bacterium]|nr:hypothetical protein [Pseudomonadaceae bacterium]
MKKRTSPQLLTPEMRTAAAELKKNAAMISADVVFKIRQIIGEPDWTPLDRTSRHQLGKYVRAHLAEFGLVHVGKAGTIALYKKFTV